MSPPPDKDAEESDDGVVNSRNGASKSKSRSGAAGRNQRAEKASEKDERERQRAETASKRKGRADRRRADGTAATIHVKVSGAHADTDSDPSEELPLAARAAANKVAQASGGWSGGSVTAEVVRPPAAAEPQPTSNPAPDTPPTTTTQAKNDKKRSHKKKGRNQYTRDRDAHDDDSPARSQSRDIQKDEHAPTSGSKAAGESSGKANSKSRGGMSSKITMNDMKRRAAALLDFISRTQVELAGESIVGPPAAGAAEKANGGPTTAPEKTAHDLGGASAAASGEGGEGRPERDFKELGCMEMMDSLTRRLVKWQQQYAA